MEKFMIHTQRKRYLEKKKQSVSIPEEKRKVKEEEKEVSQLPQLT